MKNNMYKIKNETFDISDISYMNLRTGQKSKDDTTPIYVLTMVKKSGVQVSIPFENDDESKYYFNTINNLLNTKELLWQKD